MLTDNFRFLDLLPNKKVVYLIKSTGIINIRLNTGVLL